MKILIRSAQPTDAYDIRRIQAEGWIDNNLSPVTGITQEYIAQVLKISLPPCADKINETKMLIEQSPDEYLIAEIDKNVVGWVVRHSYAEGVWAFGIYVDRLYRGKGAGTKLMSQFLSKYPDEKFKIIVSKSNTAGIRFYTGFGFQIRGKHKEHFDDDAVNYLPIVIMQNYD